jgi:hypothetical protein
MITGYKRFITLPCKYVQPLLTFGCNVSVEIPAVGIEQLKKVSCDNISQLSLLYQQRHTCEEGRGGKPWCVIKGRLDEVPTQDVIKDPTASGQYDTFDD